ncbi:MAG: 50S ribosomal protein L5 [Chloroflexota bacterium]
MLRAKERFQKEVAPQLMEELKFRNVFEVPRLAKIVISVGLGEAITNSKALEAVEKDLTAISGQHPVVRRATKSIAAFKLRAGMTVGVMVTLRGQRMYDFYDRLVQVVLPRIRDFQGLSRDSFDRQGNYSLGLREQIMFPEIEYDKVDRLRGMEITIVTTARTPEEGKRLLELLGMPFRRN